LQAAFQSFITNLRDIDTMSIVTYGGSVNVWLPPTGGAYKEKIRRAVETIVPGGDTPGEAGIRAAYQLAKSSFIPNGNNRVILATDGDFNVGESSERALDELITQERQSGVYLTCLGVGVGNFKDSKLQTLAKKGNGNYAYLDDIQEAEKVLVKELTQTLYSVADNVAMNVRFNPALVKTYRLIGFDNKKDALQDASTGLEGGEIGSGSNTVAIFEIEPTDLNTMSRYDPFIDSLATIELQYSLCQDTAVNIIRKVVPHNYMAIDSIPHAYGLAATITAFGLKLRGSPFTKTYPWQSIRAQALKYTDQNDYLQQELIMVIDKAITIYEPGKKKKRKRGK
jgi:Ca-activated chloride channel family protein